MNKKYRPSSQLGNIEYEPEWEWEWSADKFETLELEVPPGVPCPSPRSLPGPGECAMILGAGEIYCEEGLWYRPRKGDNLTKVAWRTLKRSGIKDVKTKEYSRQISNHPANAMYLSKTGNGLATRQFLPRWGGPLYRDYMGPGGGFGLMFLPPVKKDLGPKPSGGRLIVGWKVSCPNG